MQVNSSKPIDANLQQSHLLQTHLNLESTFFYVMGNKCRFQGVHNFICKSQFTVFFYKDIYEI